MRMPHRLLFFCFLLFVAVSARTFSATLDGTGAAPDLRISYLLPANQNIVPLPDGGRLAFLATSMGSTSTASVYIENRGTGSGTVNAVNLSGNGFELVSLPPFPVTVEAGKAASFAVRFKPLAAGHYTGTLKVDLSDKSVTVALDGSTAPPDFLLSYSDPRLNNNTPLSDGSPMTFPATAVSSFNSLKILIENRGTGAGTLKAVTINGAGFELASLPLLPFTLEPGKSISFVVGFTPANRQLYTGTLQITMAERSYTLRLEGTGTGPAFTYSLVSTDATTPILPDGNIAFADTEVSQTSKVVLRVSNTGTAEGRLTTLLVTAGSFTVSDSPLPPVTIKPGESIQLTLAFTPSQTDAANGRLRVGDDTFTLSGKGIGIKLEYSFTQGQATTLLDSNGAILLGSAAVGEQSLVQFTVVNRGNKAGPIFSLILSGQAGASSSTALPFQMDGNPALPLNLASGASLTFNIRFRPDNIGTALANLIVNNVGFAIVGNGLAPQRMPKFNFNGASGTQEPLQQPAVGLTLSEPYPLALQGALTLDFVSDVFSSNPAVQFATGGRVARFTIPANGTEAIFDNGAKTVRMQTGTVAGSIVIAPAFATLAGLDVTPNNPSSYTATVNRSAPKLLDIKIVNRGLSSFVVTVTGYSTNRSLKQLVLDLAPSADAKFSTMHLTADLQSAALLWFQSVPSQAYGSLFSVSVPVTVQGNGDATEDRVAKLSSVSVTATNEVGTSNSVSIPIQ